MSSIKVKWWSKTIWANILMTLSLILTEIVAKGLLQEYAVYFGLGIIIVNGILRTITTEPLITKKNGDDNAKTTENNNS